MDRSAKTAVMVRVALLAVLAVAGAWWFLSSSKPRAFVEVEPGRIYTTSYHRGADFNASIDRCQAKTVMLFADPVDLRLPEYGQAQTSVYHRKLRLRQATFAAGNWPGENDLALALDEMAKDKNHPMLIASAEGFRRPAILVAAYLTSVRKMDKAAVAGKLKLLYGDAPTLADVLRFLDGYDPASRRMTTNLPLSGE